MAARGFTTEDIASRLSISVRTAQFHFDCVRTKLGAANRQEAVERGIAQGVIMALGRRRPRNNISIVFGDRVFLEALRGFHVAT